MRKNGCAVTYLVYVFIYLVYFILLGKLFSILPLQINSDDLLVATLFISFILAALTAIVIFHRKKMLEGFAAIRKWLFINFRM